MGFKWEQPPSLKYIARLATQEEKEEIIRRLKVDGRQTMNFRLMPEAQAVVLLDRANGEKIIGWHGFHIKKEQLDLSEKFSLHLDPEYRNFLLGLALETALYKHLHDNNVESVLMRINKSSTPSLMEYRLKTGIAVLISPSEMPGSWVKSCGDCELFKKTCHEQIYFRADVEKGLSFGCQRLGPLFDGTLPIPIELVESKVRKTERGQYTAKWAA